MKLEKNFVFFVSQKRITEIVQNNIMNLIK